MPISWDFACFHKMFKMKTISAIFIVTVFLHFSGTGATGTIFFFSVVIFVLYLLYILLKMFYKYCQGLYLKRLLCQLHHCRQPKFEQFTKYNRFKLSGAFTKRIFSSADLHDTLKQEAFTREAEILWKEANASEELFFKSVQALQVASHMVSLNLTNQSASFHRRIK